MENEHDHIPPPPGSPPPPPPLPQQPPPTNLNLSTTLPITVTVAAETTFFPITFTFTTDSISIIPIDFSQQEGLQDQHLPLPEIQNQNLLPHHILNRINTRGLMELILTVLPIPSLTAPTVITIATNTIFVTIDVSATGSVLFTPLPNTTGVTIGERQQPFDRFDLSGFTTTGYITLPVILIFNVRDSSTDSTIAISITISAESVFITSDILLGITPYVAFLAEEEE